MFIKIPATTPGTNATPLWNSALRQCIASHAEGVYFPKGEYHFYPQGATRKFCYFSNNDAGIKTIAFHLDGLNGFSLVADDAAFIFHGRICPVVAENCNGLHLQGFSIDFSDDYTNDVQILDNCADGSWIHMDGKFRVVGGKFHFLHDFEDNSSGLIRLTAYEPTTGCITRQKPGASFENQILKRKGDAYLVPFLQQADDTRRFFHARHQERTNPAIVCDLCKDVAIVDCAIHQAGGMGLLMQNTENILVDTLCVVPAPGRTVASSDDATHFSECSGTLEMRNCKLRHTLDDAVNIHGLYWKLRHRMGEILLGCGHFQHLGLQHLRPGDELEFSKAATLQTYAHVKVKAFKNANPQYGFVDLDGALPPDFEDGDIVRSVKAANLQATIANCTIHDTHSRGILFTGIRKGVIENNTIHTPAAGVHISGDMNFWFEAGPDEDVIIRNNTFDFCNQTQTSTGKAQITIAPELPAPLETYRFHKRIEITGNTFNQENDAPIVDALSVKDLRVHDNTLNVNGTPATPNIRTSFCG